VKREAEGDWGAVTKISGHFKHNISLLDDAGEQLAHLGGRKTIFWQRSFTKPP
jgi:hypothetical protein